MALAAAIGALALGTAACSRHETRVEQGNREKILHVGNGGDIADLDPHTAIGAIEGDVMGALFEPLIQLDPVDLHPVPGAAASWEVSPDGRVYTFHLRPDAKWSNGDPLRAGDWVYSFRRLITPALAAPFLNYATLVEGATEYSAGKTTDFGTVGVREIDPLTLEIRLRNPTPYFPAVLNFWPLYPVHRATIEKFDAFARPGQAWTRAGNLVGNGPFILKEWIPNDHITVVANPNYWGHDKARLREIRFYPVDNTDTEERMFRAGQLHVASSVPVTKIEAYRREHSDALHVTPILGTFYFALNTRNPPLNDLRVRRALALAIDRKAIVDTVLRGGERPAYAFTPDGMGDYVVGAKLKADVNEARRLLAEAGFPGGAGFPKLDVIFNTNGTYSALAEAIQFMWKRELGIESELRNMEWKVYLNTVHNGNFQVARLGWEAVVLDPHDFLEQFRTNSSNNWTGWSNPEYDRILEESERTSSNADRYQLLQKLDAIIEREMPIIPIYHNTHRSLVHPAVKDWPDNAINIKIFQQTYLEPK
jgi:oligopeptide transport system substrate-binding protein